MSCWQDPDRAWKARQGQSESARLGAAVPSSICDSRSLGMSQAGFGARHCVAAKCRQCRQGMGVAREETQALGKGLSGAKYTSCCQSCCSPPRTSHVVPHSGPTVSPQHQPQPTSAMGAVLICLDSTQACPQRDHHVAAYVLPAEAAALQMVRLEGVLEKCLFLMSPCTK